MTDRNSVTPTITNDNSSVAQISAGYMRAAGGVHNFQGLLNSPWIEKGDGLFKWGRRARNRFRLPFFKRQSTDDPQSNSLSSDEDSIKAFKSSVSYRLTKRKEIFESRRATSDLALIASLLGIFMMLVENELTFAQIYDKSSPVSWTLKFFILISTVCLLAFVAHYHALEVRLYLIDNSAEDWRIAMNPGRVFRITLELLVCAVCPLPGRLMFTWVTIHANGTTVTSTEVPVDVLLSIPMFLRLYLVCRVMFLHSRMFTDTTSRSIGALNRISMNARFVLKTLMTLCPGTVLLVITASFWVIASWLLRLCERYHTGPQDNITDALKHRNYLNSLWLVAITFLSVGYGDLVPNTYCGRAVSVAAGIMGAGTSSFVVAVIAKKLELSLAEKHVHNFMMDTQLTKKLKHAAANVLRETWLIYKNRRLVHHINPGKIRLHQRKFLLAIYELRKVKRELRKLADNQVTFGHLAKTTASTYELVSAMHSWQNNVVNRLTSVETKLELLQTQLDSLPDRIAQKSQLLLLR